LGLAENCIAPWYKQCQDVTTIGGEGQRIEWMNTFHETCTMYGEEKWCTEHGLLENEDGMSAKEACCACGGGVHLTLHSDML